MGELEMLTHFFRSPIKMSPFSISASKTERIAYVCVVPVTHIPLRFD